VWAPSTSRARAMVRTSEGNLSWIGHAGSLTLCPAHVY
jgi:hypothetical protein